MVKQFDDLNNNPDAVTIFINGQQIQILPVQMKPVNMRDHVHIQIGRSQVDGSNSVDEEGGEKGLPVQAHFIINSPKQRGLADGKDQKREIMQLPDEALPDTKKYIKQRHHLSIPKLEECRTMPEIDLQRFSSTWLSLSVKKINVKQHVDFKSTVSKEEFEEPVCKHKISSHVIGDDIPGIQHRNHLHYRAEAGLREVLQKIGVKIEPVEVIGTRIARALKKNETSWVITNLAGLYWRVRGSAKRAIECLRIAAHLAPKHSKDVALLSIANVLHRAGYINDAIMVLSYSMDVSPGLVVGHFNMANLYAAKAQWDYATMFYESTLGLQATFEPAKQRLRFIHCMRVVRQPSKE